MEEEVEAPEAAEPAHQPGAPVVAAPRDSTQGEAAGPIRDCKPTYVDATMQTVEKADAGIQCEAPAANTDELLRQLASPAVARFLCRAIPLCEQALQQNELTDVLKDEFAGLAEDDALQGGSGAGADKVAVHQSFTDVLHSKGRALPAVQWHPTRNGVMAVACAEPLNLTERAQRAGQPAPTAILLWDYHDPIHPEAVLQAPDDVFAFAFNPTSPQWVAAGCLGGQVVLWNLDQLAQQRQQAARLQLYGSGGGAGPSGGGVGGSRRGSAEQVTTGEGAEAAAHFLKANMLQPAYVSMLDASHQARIADLHWLPGLAATRDGRLEPAASPSECFLFATTAMDGKVLVWDMRIYSSGRRRNRPTAEDDMVEWKPVLTMPVQNSTGQPLPCTRLSLDAKPSSTTRVVLGSLDGDMAVVDANIRGVDTNRTHNTVGHASSSCGHVRSLSYSPFFDDLLLAVADSGFLIWQDRGGELGQQPLFESRFSDVLYTTGCWSPTKPGVILLGRLDGKLEIWDLLDRVHMPVAVAPVTPAAILSLAFSPGPSGAASRSSTHHVLAVADAAGVLHVVDVPRTLRRRGHGEVKAMATLMEREQRRLAYIQERQDARAKLQKEMEPKRRASIQLAQSSAALAAAGSKQQQQAPPGDTSLDAEQRAELAYQQLEQEWRAKLGLALPAAPATSRSVSLSCNAPAAKVAAK